jgi:hypothetical protein
LPHALAIDSAGRQGNGARPSPLTMKATSIWEWTAPRGSSAMPGANLLNCVADLRRFDGGAPMG